MSARSTMAELQAELDELCESDDGPLTHDGDGTWLERPRVRAIKRELKIRERRAQAWFAKHGEAERGRTYRDIAARDGGATLWRPE